MRSFACALRATPPSKAVAAKLTAAAPVELRISVGFYIMTSKFLETFDVDMQPVEQAV